MAIKIIKAISKIANIILIIIGIGNLKDNISRTIKIANVKIYEKIFNIIKIKSYKKCCV